MHGPTLYEMLVVLVICTLTFLLPVVSRRRVEAFRYHPKYEELLQNYRFSRRFSLALLALVLIISALNVKEPGRGTILTVGAGSLVLVYGIIWIAVNFTDLPDDYLDALGAVTKRGEVTGWWIGRGQKPQYVHQTWSPKEEVSFPRNKGYLFLKGHGIANINLVAKDKRRLIGLLVFRGTSATDAADFQDQHKEIEEAAKSKLQSLLDTNSDTSTIRQQFLDWLAGTYTDITVETAFLDLHPKPIRLIGNEEAVATA